ncbi:hypothetical protein COU37_01230 [Candidatus Micrarchaeota archaeon CG10_big_fil_rev_8_21_14_0_10_45_29]|nr:MAG: hypothetical protein COU37_01230 [Candidatus Micrarchaeota archaeon CG10_big_fil_rev_8_21_14_0_10_45_29]
MGKEGKKTEKKKEKKGKNSISVPLIEPKEKRGGDVKYSQIEFSNLKGAGALKNLVKIERDSLIELIILKYPQLAADLMEAGMHCVGCPAAGFETLYEGCAAHGMSDKQIDALIKKLNKTIGAKEREIKKGRAGKK